MSSRGSPDPAVIGVAPIEPVLRLALVKGVGPQRYAALVERFGSPDAVLGAGVRSLAETAGVGRHVAREIVAAAGPPGDHALARARDALDRAGAIAIIPTDPRYPSIFHDLPDPPFILFLAGDPSLLRRPGVAIVGTRLPTPYGREVATRLSNGLALAGYSVISGMARGVDTIAHQAALDARGTTVGVLGHGIDRVYPPENRQLFREVRERGLLITEMIPGERPLAGNFPRRNRLIAALSSAVLVVEMAMKSGAQHTVTFALELGREVMAVPGPITSRASAGTNQLLKDGARVVTGVEDVIEELGGVGAAASQSTGLNAMIGDGAGAQPTLNLLTDEERGLLRRMESGAIHVDALDPDGRFAPGRLLSVMLELEMKGAVEALPGKMYRRR